MTFGPALHRLWLPATAAMLAACATLPPEIPEVAECQANYLGLDQRLEAAGLRDGGAARIEGFPYLRVNRFLASFRDEAADGPAFAAWVERLRELDLAARRAELRNLGWQPPDPELRHLDRCGREWAARDLADPQRRAQLREQARVPDDYSALRRTLGFYPLAVPFLNLGISNYHEEIRADYATPAAALESPGPLVLWRGPAQALAPATVAAWLAQTDALGVPILDEARWQRLAAAHLPQWLVETGGDYDRPGAVVLGEAAPTVDPAQPVTYFRPAYTRFGGEVLAQLVYTVWFSERPPQGLVDSYSGALDGVVWRVTLDRAGAPLVYDTIHPCGCYHYVFAAQPLARKPQGGAWDEPKLFPQQELPAAPFAIRIQSGTHYVRRLVPLAAIAQAPSRDYAVLPYETLLSLPDGQGGTRSLFCEDGLACGTERFERFWLWPAGIESAGAMRQWGRQATSFVGKSHFDDPDLLERMFEPL